MTLYVEPMWRIPGWATQRLRFGFLLLCSALLVFHAMPSGAIIEGPPGANTGDAPADFEGMAISVEVGSHTGNATFEYPFELPPGRNQLEPNLRLVYSHQVRATRTGEGWELPVGRIERSARLGPPRYTDTGSNADILEVTLPNSRFELVREAGGWAARVDDVHVWVEEGPGSSLLMRMPSGRSYLFGGSADARIYRPGQPQTQENTFAWHLTRIVDPNANRIDISYGQWGGYAHPSLVEYGANGFVQPHIYRVELDWSSRNPEQFRTTCTSGFCRTAQSYLNQLAVRRGSQLIRQYSLEWSQSAANGAPLLREIQTHGSDGTPLTKADGTPASTRFEYHEPTLPNWDGSLPEERDWEALDHAEAITFDEFKPEDATYHNRFRDWNPFDPCTNRDFVDINGDGRPDWVRSGDWTQSHKYWKVKLNNGSNSADLFGPEFEFTAPHKCLAKRVKATTRMTTNYSNFHALADIIGSGEIPFGTRTTSGMVDIDADGLLEYVDAEKLKVGENFFWKVYQQNQNASNPGFELSHELWPVPKTHNGGIWNGINVYTLDREELFVHDFQIDEPSNGITAVIVGDTFIPSPPSGDDNYIRMKNRPVSALLDMNGDGLPDLVDAGLGGSVPGNPNIGNYGGTNHGNLYVYWNLGNGFASTYEVMLGGPTGEPIRDGGGSKPVRNVTVEMFDINGDGLRDVVKAQGQSGSHCEGSWQWAVWYGTGIAYPNTHTVLGNGELPSFDGPHCWAGPAHPRLRRWGTTKASVDVVDVNADGLPDFVDASNFQGNSNPSGSTPPYRPEWVVWINRGTHLEELGPRFFAKNIRTNDLKADGETVMGLSTDTFDLDGNGWLDHIHLGNQGFLKVNFRHPSNLRPNVLTRVTNPMGGTTDIGYDVSTRFNTPEVDPAIDPDESRFYLPFPLWVVKSLTRSVPGDAETPPVETRFDYEGGFFDFAERIFSGFRTVERVERVPHPVTQAPVDGPHTTTEYHQTLGLAGLKQREVHFVENGHNGLLWDHRYAWNLDLRESASGQTRYFPTLGSRTEYDASSQEDEDWKSLYCPCDPTQGGFRARETAYIYDACGNVTEETISDLTSFLQQTGSPVEERQSTRSYGLATTGDQCDASLRVCTGICDRMLTQSIDGGLSEEFAYDASGNQTEASRLGPQRLSIQRFFDGGLGQLSRIIDPEGNTSLIAWDADYLFPAIWIADAGGASLPTTLQYDPLFGRMTSHTGPSGDVTRYAYDFFGRLISVAEPGQSLSQPTRRYAYKLDTAPNHRSSVETHHLEPTWSHGGAYRIDSTFHDGLGRRLQSQQIRLVDDQLRVVVSDAVRYDAGGRVSREYSPIPLNVAFSNDATTFYWPLPESAPFTRLRHDEFGRVRVRERPDGTERETDYRTAWATEECDAVHAQDSDAGKCTSTQLDALGRVRFRRVTLGSRFVPDLQEERQYYPSGQLAFVEYSHANDATRVRTSFSYDAYDRLITRIEPSSGIWNLDYDKNDNIVLEDDPEPGRDIITRYDGLNRPIDRFERIEIGDDERTTLRRTEFAYDTAGNGLGRLRQIRRRQYPGAGSEFEYTRTFHEYDGRGNPLAFTEAISAGGISHSYRHTRRFDAIGRLTHSSLPLPTGHEQLLRSYSDAGSLTSLGSNLQGPYAQTVLYDEQQRIIGVDYGNAVMERFDFYDEAGIDPVGGGAFAGHAGRLRRLRSTGPSQILRELNYLDYSRNGQVERVEDGAGSIHLLAEYDPAGRISRWSADGSVFRDYAFDGLGRIQSKGNIPFAYSTELPLQIASVDGQTVDYDYNGNVRVLPGGRVFDYDADSNLIRAQHAADVTEYFYDADGTRRAVLDPDGTVRFFFDDFDIVGEEVKRHVKLAGRLIATSTVALEGTAVNSSAAGFAGAPKRAHLAPLALSLLTLGMVVFGARSVRSGWLRAPRCALAGTASLLALGATCDFDERIYYHVDHLGSPHVLSDEMGDNIEARRFAPYGEVADGPADTQGEFGLTGHRKTEPHGMAYFGARYYVPELASFASLDPRSQFANPYSYANGDPLNNIDPTGAEFVSAASGAFVLPPPLPTGGFRLEVIRTAPFRTFGGGFEGGSKVSRAGAVNFQTREAGVDTPMQFTTRGMEGAARLTQGVNNLIGRSGRGNPVASPASASVDAAGQASFRFGMSGGNGLIPMSPHINTEVDMNVSLEPGFMNVAGTLSGDDFPSATLLVEDPSGDSLVIDLFRTDRSGDFLDGPVSLMFDDGEFHEFQGQIPLTDEGLIDFDGLGENGWISNDAENE